MAAVFGGEYRGTDLSILYQSGGATKIFMVNTVKEPFLDDISYIIILYLIMHLGWCLKFSQVSLPEQSGQFWNKVDGKDELQHAILVIL